MAFFVTLSRHYWDGQRHWKGESCSHLCLEFIDSYRGSLVLGIVCVSDLAYASWSPKALVPRVSSGSTLTSSASELCCFLTRGQCLVEIRAWVDANLRISVLLPHYIQWVSLKNCENFGRRWNRCKSQQQSIGAVVLAEGHDSKIHKAQIIFYGASWRIKEESSYR